MDQQPKYNRILNYKPESNRAIREVAPDQYAMCGVLNTASISSISPALPEYSLNHQSQWQSGRSIRINPMGDRGLPVTPNNSRGVYHRNCMWFDVEIDKQYLLDNNITQLDTILRGNISDRMIYSSIWWPVDQGQPIFDFENISIGPNRPEDPTPGDIWAETSDPLPGPPRPPGGTIQDVVIAVWEYQDLTGGEEFYDWVIISGSEDGLGIYNTTTINNIPTYALDPDRECRFIVQVHWNMILSNTAEDREMALYVFDGSTDATRQLSDYIVKSPIVTMSNRVNPGPPGPWEPSQKGFVPAEMFDYYDNPRGKNLSIPITNTEIVMTVNSGTATIDPNDEYEDIVFIDLIGEGASLTLNYGSGSEAWVMAPVDDGTYIGNYPYYIGKQTVGAPTTYGPTTNAGQLTITGTGRFGIYGPDAILPRSPDIAQWLKELSGAPDQDHIPLGVLTASTLQNTRGLSKITNWQGILQGTGSSMFRNVSGDFVLPEYQLMSDLTDTFALCSDFTDIADALKTWITDTATSMDGTFKNCVNYNKDPEFVINNITNMRETFKGCSKFDTDINHWNVSKVTDMYGMFAGCSVFNQPLNEWDTGEVLNMGYMFDGCSQYDQFIAQWEVSQILSKPEGFDRNTKSEWEAWEKPWWGEELRPDVNKYFVFEALTPDIVLKIRGETDLKLWDLDNKKFVRDIIYTSADIAHPNSNINLWVNLSDFEGLPRPGVIGRLALTGSTKALGFASQSIWRLFYDAVYDAYTRPKYGEYTSYRSMHYERGGDPYELGGGDWDYISHSGPAVGIDPVTKESIYTKDNIINDITQAKDYDHTILNALYDKIFTQALGDGTTWEKLSNVAEGLTEQAFSYLGRLPDNLPDDLVFGWNDMDQSERETLMKEGFVACSNFPERSITSNWEIRVDPEHADLSGAFSYLPDVTNVGGIIDNICQKTQSIDASRIHQCSVLTNIDQITQDIEVTSLEQAFRYADLTDTRGKITVANLEHTSCSSWTQAYMFTRGENHFVSDIVQNITMPNTSLYEEFAYTQCVPDQITSWDFTNTSNITRMFYMSRFPDRFNNVDLSGYHSEVDEQGRLFDYNAISGRYPNIYDLSDMPNYQSDMVFTGCSGTPVEMLDWKLPPPKPLNLGGIFYRDVLIPWWFAGCSEFDCDLQSWQTTRAVNVEGAEFDPITRNNQSIVIRIGTFAYCENFNSQIDWYYPDEYYFPLEYMRGYQSDNNLEVAYKAAQYNKDYRLLDTVLYGRSALQHIWWRTFVGAEKYNNGNNPLPVIMASDMVDTFRGSGLDQDVTIRKPSWGKAYYQGVFEDTTSWTAPRVIDFECQNRSNTPELENIYYHAIMAQRMFKNSTFMGTLAEGFKWFFYNVTNVNGCHYSRHGSNKEFMDWTDYSELQDLRSREQAGTLGSIQTGSLTDSFGAKPIYNNKVMRTTNHGPRRAPQGNVIDSEFEYTNSSDPYSYKESNNSGLVDLPFPPLNERYMSAYAIRPIWHMGRVRIRDRVAEYLTNYNHILFEDTAWYEPHPAWAMREDNGRSSFGKYFNSQPRTPVETSNMKEMFAGAVNFTQDLSEFRTRLSPPAGALLRKTPDPVTIDPDNIIDDRLKPKWPSDGSWPDDYYFGEDELKAEATFNRRAEGNVKVINPNQGGYARAAYKDIMEYHGRRLILRKISDYELQMIAKPSYVQPSEENYPWGATFKAIPNLYVTIANKKAPGLYPTTTFYKIPSMQPCPSHTNEVPGGDYSELTSVNLDVVVYKSTTSEHYLIRDTYTRNGVGYTNYDYWITSALDCDLFNLNDYEEFTLVDLGEDTLFDRLHDDGVSYDPVFVQASVTGSTPNGWPKTLNHVYVPNNFTVGTGPSAYYSPITIDAPDGGLPLQNGHSENDYGDKFRTLKDYEFWTNSTIYPDQKINPGPYRPDMDLIGVDDMAIEKPTTDLIDKSITDNIRSMYYYVKSVPTDFATGANNFTSDKWPTWMVGYTDQPQSAVDIENHFDPDNTRDPGDSRYITTYAWHHEPYNWPDGDIYRDGEY